MKTAGEISVIKRSASWRNPDSAIAESSAIIKNAAAGPARPSMSASQAKRLSKQLAVSGYCVVNRERD